MLSEDVIRLSGGTVMVIQTRVTPIMMTWYDKKPYELSTLAMQAESIKDAATMINLTE
jgi:hypothetical protein